MVVIKLRAVTAMAEMVKLVAGMVVGMLLRVRMVEMVLLVKTEEMPMGEMEETRMAETEEMRMAVMETVMGMEMVVMAEGTATVMVTQETQMTKPMMSKS